MTFSRLPSGARSLVLPALLAVAALAGCGDKTTTASDACAQACGATPEPVCRDGSLVTFVGAPACDTGFCVWDEQLAECDFGCGDGRCLPDPGPCFEVACVTPPRDRCIDGQTAEQYEGRGACDNLTGECSYAPANVPCAEGTVCFEGACVPPDCSSVECDEPPADTCEGDVRVEYGALGTCDPETLDCSYTEFRSDCAELGQQCVDGRCVLDDSCEGITCVNTAQPRCEDSVAVVPDTTGTCDAGVCSYGDTRLDCADSGRICVNGACADPCDGVTCNEPPLSTCDGDIATIFVGIGTCDAGECTYTSSTRDCTADGLVCTDGACIADPLCGGVACDDPPVDICEGDVAVLHPRVGVCEAGACSYAQSRQDCALLGQDCVDGACVDLCEGIVCTAPPEDTCDGDVATFYGRGTCVAGTCSYEEFTEDCVASGLACVDGFCRAACEPSACLTPPDPFCTDALAITYAPTGSCEDDLCVYDEIVTDCGALGQLCSDGACVVECFDDGPCDAPPEPTCEGDVLVEYDTVGTCDEAIEACTYGTARTDCAASGQACDAGECVDACAVIVCAPAPPPFCDDEILVQSTLPATCEGGVCQFTELRVDCTESGRICLGGACVDACIGVVCNSPPAPECSGDVLSRPRNPGLCVLGECTYPDDALDCASFGFVCEDAACVDPCIGVTCTDIPDDRCEGDQVVLYTGESGCVDGECLYAAFRADCTETGLVCQDAECIDPCDGITCTTPSAPECQNDVAVASGASGFCALGVCNYPDASVDCSEFSGWCRDGLCVDACSDIVCGAPPADTCDGQVAVDYISTPPTCEGGVCSFDAVRTDCLALGLQCVGGSCVPVGDVCSVIDCAARTAFCDGDFRVTDSGPGVCDATSRTCDRTASETRTECEPPLGCLAGTCQRVPQPGEIVLTEVFYDGAGSDEGREWFEVRNVSTATLALGGLEVVNTAGQRIAVPPGLTLAAGAYRVFKASPAAAGGAPGTVYTFGTFSLANSGDSLSVVRNGVVLDTFVWNEGPFPEAVNGSLAVAPGSETAFGNDAASAWCLSETIYDVGRGERGTPGSTRTTCR
jgi:hypothetical protein